MKKKKSAAKPYKVKGSCKISYNKCGNRQLSKKKSQKRKRRLRKDTTVSSAMHRRTKTMIQA